MKNLLILSLILTTHVTYAQYDGNTTPTYPDLIEIYKELASGHDEIELYNMGESDYGLPIYICMINGAQDSTKTFLKARENTTILINNAIHPGEPDGVNACLIWIEDWIDSGKKTKNLPVIGIIPTYNVGGAMNRSGTSRANQNGPEEYGFRGNAQNLDLNRDYIKMDSKNMFTFAKIYHAMEPDVFIDTHVSNGADYQYVMTYIASVKERMSPELGSLMHEKMVPYLEDYSSENGYDIVPYVHLKGETPEKGIEVFNDLPRYAMGYASLLNSISFTTETHMLKPFPERVQSTLVFIEGTIEWTSKNANQIELARSQALDWEENLNYYKFNFKLTDQKDSLLFQGFEFSNPVSQVTGEKRLKYHKDQPYEKWVPYYNVYESKDSCSIPEYYLVEGQCKEVLSRLSANNVEMIEVTSLEHLTGGIMQMTYFESARRPYEGHFMHSKVKKEERKAELSAKVGDYLIPTSQKNKRFIVSVLEPETPDSYFVWNYFDSYVQQKEYFSPYVFEDKALKILAANPELKLQFEAMKASDKDFAESTWDQLYFIYKNSNMFEPTFNVLPVHPVTNR